MYLEYIKQASGVLPTAADYNLFYNNGSSGTLSDLVAQPNTDLFSIVKSWVHKVGFAASNGTGANLGWSSYSNNECP